ncbi:MAG: class I SAM-dependent methyltransferase [Armatimonadetes bacterium]|nr:class I SAM-dependent methyltransferase [Armatimonadota bacterium]
MAREPWYENEEFWETFRPILLGETRYSAAAKEVQDVIALGRISVRSSLLDLCCGTGRHALEFARQGFQVTGVDRTEKYLEIARKQAHEEGLSLELVKEDARSFSRPNAFDGAINLFTSFGYFEDPEDDRRVLRNLHRSLKTGAPFVIDLMGKEILARVFKERDWLEEDGLIMLEERKLHKNWSWIENRWIILKNGERKDFELSHRLYSAFELEQILKECGFEEISVYGDLAGAPYDHMAKRLVAVAHKGN